MKPTPKTSTPIKPATQTTEPSIDLQEQIRLRAYQLYERRRREDGRDLEDWLQAESEVTQNQQIAQAHFCLTRVAKDGSEPAIYLRSPRDDGSTRS
jgi:Protein of unknown function (DUF2934)